jgi:exoribonuclease R
MSEPPNLDRAFARIRRTLGVPDEFPPEVVAEATAAADRLPVPHDERARRADYGIVPFVTIDPASSMDLDQAFYAQARGDGYIVLYAIADVGYFVDRDGAVEDEAWKRGQTLYSPDTQTLLYPEVLSRGAASLLPEVERPCVLFSFELDHEGRAKLRAVERALVVSHAKLDYESVSRHLAAERSRAGSGELAGREWSESLGLLETIGRLRQALEIERGGVSLPIAAQHVQKWSAALAGYRLTLRNPDDVEGWNAQISLMTGIHAARLMVRNAVGLLRVLDPPREERLQALRITAAALGIAWPEEMSYPDFIRSLDPRRPIDAAILFHAVGVMGAARYVAFDGAVPTGGRHAAIASYYAHTTAPLRRLADRYVLDLLVELAAGKPAGSAGVVLQGLPAVMLESDRIARALEAAIVDHAEAELLADRTGEVFDALVIRVREDRVTVQLTDPPVRAEVPVAGLAGVDGDAAGRVVDDGAAVEMNGVRLQLGESLSLRLEAADPEGGRLTFGPA